MMTELQGYYYDGTTSIRHPVGLRIDAGSLLLTGDGFTRSFPLAEVRPAPRLGSLRRSLHLSNGGLCELENSPAVEEVLRLLEPAPSRHLHRWESNLRLVFIAVLLTVGLVWGLLQYGFPFLAKQAAFTLPPATEASLGREALEMLDKMLFTPSELPEPRRQELLRRFNGMLPMFALPGPSRLEFRKSGRVGANAFALPGGIVILTDDMVKLAQNDDELAAVIAHELGHVRQRHILRHVLQSSATGLVIATVTGDIVSATSLAATLPTAVIDAKFSRDFETEADNSAAGYLRQAGIPLKRFAEILTRLQAEQNRRAGKEEKETKNRVTDFLSSHPDTSQRIKRFQQDGSVR